MEKALWNRDKTGVQMNAQLDDPRIAAGMAAQLASRRDRIAAGEKPIGWKVGLSTEAAMKSLSTNAPLVGFLTDAGALTSGATSSLAGWTKPVAEPEVAVHIGKDVPGSADDATAADAIIGLSPAIELVDLHTPPEDVEAILTGNVYHRHVVLGAMDRSRAGGDVSGLKTRVLRNGDEVAEQSPIDVNTGTILSIVRHVAAVVSACGEGLKAGDIVIAGSITPPHMLSAEDREFVHMVDGMGDVSVRFTH